MQNVKEDLNVQLGEPRLGALFVVVDKGALLGEWDVSEPGVFVVLIFVIISNEIRLCGVVSLRGDKRHFYNFDYVQSDQYEEIKVVDCLRVR